MGFNKQAGDQLPASELNSFYSSAGLYGASSNGTDSYSITVTPAPVNYSNGDTYTFKADVANTGAATLNVNGLGAKSLVKYGNQALTDGNIAAGSFVKVVYDASNNAFQIWSTVLEGYQVSSGYWNSAIKLGTDFTIDNVGTITTVTGFSFAATSGETWYIEIMGSCSANNTASDILADIYTTGTWANTQSYHLGAQYFNATGTFTNTAPAVVNSSTLVFGNITINNGDGVVRPFMMKAQVVMTGSGNVNFGILTASAAAGRTATVKAGTYMLARKLST